MFSSDLTVRHEHHQMNMIKGFVLQRCGRTGRLQSDWPLHLVPEGTRVWIYRTVD